jgi:biopolymer transport protein ExbD
MPLSFSTGKKVLAEYSLAGLADIVLLLLIFFLLTSNFIPQFGIQVNLPQAESSAPMESEYLNIAITSEGRFYVDQAPVSRENLLSEIQNVRGDRGTLVLRADKDATVGQFAEVANVGRALGMRVLMATERASLRPQ